MTVLVYKDGRLLTDEGNPLEGISLEGLLACIADPKPGQVLTYDGTMWVNKTLPSILPVSITDPQDGDTLVYSTESEAWVNTAAAEEVNG